MNMAIVRDGRTLSELFAKRFPDLSEKSTQLNELAQLILACLPDAPDFVACRFDAKPLGLGIGVNLENLNPGANSFDLRFRVKADAAVIGTWRLRKGQVTNISQQLAALVLKANHLLSTAQSPDRSTAAVKNKRDAQLEVVRDLLAKHADEPKEVQLLLALDVYKGGQSMRTHIGVSKKAFFDFVLSLKVPAFRSQAEEQAAFIICNERSYIGQARHGDYNSGTIYLMKKGAERLRRVLVPV